MVFWTDSFEKAIKRSYIPGDKVDSKIGFAQDLEIKSECNGVKIRQSVLVGRLVACGAARPSFIYPSLKHFYDMV